ncbi:serine hydrolase domain-containing protein [Salinimicrobium oceani]|uniref:Serine hydrolase n=1 Tax=Salinimicrobium oceani TaxID=2722702 RepID=A0ABX1D322_9FLAO|nr:serine hydrolase [Salinimicrobium oceani]NJW53078.1 serine hydrolase [Salinimicrobium oceani]
MKKILSLILVLVALGIGVVVYIYYPRLNLITGFAAKNMCSCVFEADRSVKSVVLQDNNFDPVNYAEYEVNDKEAWATATVFGLKERKAAYYPGLGCVLLPEDLDKTAFLETRPNRIQSHIAKPYPYGHEKPHDTSFAEVKMPQLEKALQNAFFEEQGTRAIVVLYKDHLLAEKYAEGFSERTKFLGWSMTKSITSAVLGVLEKQGRIALDERDLFLEWEKDQRSEITLENLLHMNSGLEWEEDYTKISDVTQMLFLAQDMARVQLENPLVAQPGTLWNYSSGTTNLLSGYIRDRFSSQQEYLDFWYSGLIDRIGMHSMTLEADLSGNYVGSSYSWATARDWAKFGLLYLRKGNWNGEQILSEAWIAHTIEPVEGSSGHYGAHFWLNAGGSYPDVPRDLFSANGFQGQHVFVIPSKDLVVVRFGLIEHPEFDLNIFLREIVAAVE